MATANTATNNQDAAKAANKFASVKALSQALAKSGANEWAGGLAFDKYTDVYNSDGSLKTFPTKATAELPATEQKIGGRYIADAAGRERKLYNAFSNLLTSALAGIKSVTVKEGEESVTFMSIEGASFGIGATLGEKEEGKEYAPITHSLLATKKEADDFKANATVVVAKK